MSESTFLAPKRFDEYRLLRPLGEGTMGQVVLCMDTALYRRVAVKFLKGVELDPSQKERFWIEARAIARLSHPNIVTIYRVGQYQGTPYLVSEFIEGQSLDRLPRPLPWDKVLPIAVGIARGLDAAHRSGVLHRDIKPANIMLTSRGEVKLLDFGLAKVVDNLALAGMSGAANPALIDSGLPRPALGAEPEQGPGATLPPPTGDSIQLTSSGRRPVIADDGTPGRILLTEAGIMLGTPLYMSPEAWEGEPATARSDVYSLGVVLYELLCGVPPHHAPICSLIRELALTSPAAPIASRVEELNPELAAIVDRCVRQSPRDRFASASEVLAALEALIGSQPQSAPDRRRRRRIYRTVGLLSLLSVSGVGYLYVKSQEPTWPSGTALIAAGTFTLGSTADEQESALNWCRQVTGSECGEEERLQLSRERPQHKVTVSAFRMDRTEVTNSSFVDWLNQQKDLSLTENRYLYQGTVLLADLYPRYEPANGFVWNRRLSRYEVPKGNERHPVTQVTWEAARRYCQSKGMRLPTEAEWEYAARGVEGRPFPWGFESPLCDRVNVARASGQPCAVMKGSTIAVGTAAQDVTPDGIYDLAGNVAEWVLDAFHDTYRECPSPCKDPIEETSVTAGERRQRVLRGGSWLWAIWSSRSASRSRWWSNEAVQNVGFRCVSPVR